MAALNQRSNLMAPMAVLFSPLQNSKICSSAAEEEFGKNPCYFIRSKRP